MIIAFTREFTIRREVQSAASILRSATSVNAEIVMEPHLGKIQPGCCADILIVDGDPLEDIGVLGTSVTAQLAPALGDVVELARPDLPRRKHHLSEIVEIATPVPVAYRQEEILLRGEVLVNGAFRIARGVGDIVESRCREAFFGEHLLGGIEEQRTRVLKASLPGPALNHGAIVPQDLRNALVIQIPTGIFTEIDGLREGNRWLPGRRKSLS